MKITNVDLRTKLIDVAKQYSNNIVSPINENIKVNVYISGSVSYGFCDNFSDIEMEFYFLDGTDQILINKVDQALKALPVFLDVRISAGISTWSLENIINSNLDDYWGKFNPYTLYELNSALPIREDVPLIAKVKEKLSFYPKGVSDSVVRGLWLTTIDSGTYNTDYSFKRNETIISCIFFFRAMEALLRLAYIANKKYYPPTKWLARGISTLPLDFGLGKFVYNFEVLQLNKKIARLNDIADKISTYLVENGMMEKKYKENAWEIMSDKYYIFSTF